jgi:hypothetical protein
MFGYKKRLFSEGIDKVKNGTINRNMMKERA